MEILVKESINAWQALGKVTYGATDAEKAGLRFRRSIYVVEDIKENEELTIKNIRIIRPGKGLLPKHYEKLLGRRVNQNLERGTAFKWEMLKEK